MDSIVDIDEHSPERRRKVRVCTSGIGQRLVASDAYFIRKPNAERGLYRIYPQRQRQHIIGFGGAVTESVALTWSKLDPQHREEVMRYWFSPDESAYNLLRMPLMSCDFSQRTYEYRIERQGNRLESLKLADVDEQLIIPFIQKALTIIPSLEVMVSPWSPPAFAKSNHLRRFGGRLRPRFRRLWGQSMARAIAELRARGIPVTRVTVQNEPAARQSWESCIYTAEEEISFAVECLARALVEEGLDDIRILLWDHNKDALVQRVEAYDAWLAKTKQTADPKTRGLLAGYAFHQYTGDHFDALRMVREEHPRAELIMSEMCVPYTSESSNDAMKAEAYLHELMGDLNAGVQGFVDWNLLLDAQGGPNHAGNYCNAPLMTTDDGRDVVYGLESTYLRQVTGSIPAGSRVLRCSTSNDQAELLATIAPDGTRTAVLLNRQGAPCRVQLAEGEYVVTLEMGAHSLVTCTW